MVGTLFNLVRRVISPGLIEDPVLLSVSFAVAKVFGQLIARSGL